MTLQEACKKWIKDFSMIPTSLIKKAYKENPDELILLSSEYPEIDFPACWGYMFCPNNLTDESWIENNINKVQECGILVYQSDECGLLLGIDGCGYDFYDEHWIPLYKARCLKWHDD